MPCHLVHKRYTGRYMSNKQTKTAATKPAKPTKMAKEFEDLDRAMVNDGLRRARSESQNQVARISARFAPKKPLR